MIKCNAGITAGHQITLCQSCQRISDSNVGSPLNTRTSPLCCETVTVAVWGSDKTSKSWVRIAKCCNNKKAFYCLPLSQVRCSPAVTTCICSEQLQHHHMVWLKGIPLSFWHTHMHAHTHTHPALPLGRLNVSCQNSGVSIQIFTSALTVARSRDLGKECETQEMQFKLAIENYSSLI